MPEYYLSVGCLFKNESAGICEWLDHHIAHGVDHFFLIDDASTDRSVELLQPYIEKRLVTLFTANCSYYWCRQRDIYNKYLLPIVSEKTTQWLAVLDMDEFLWSRQYTSLKTSFECCNHFGQLQFQWRMFGSNGHITQPESIIRGFTRRQDTELMYDDVWSFKYAVNSNFEFEKLDVHNAVFVHENDTTHNWRIIGEPIFALNHYCCQSRNFWNQVKCTRGDSNNFRVRTHDDFDLVDHNDVEDTELLERNINIGILTPTVSDSPQYKLSIGTIFKNESHGIIEWIEFYLASGVDHFFMINDSSTDNSVELIQSYIEQGLVSLYHSDWDRHFGRQGEMLSHFIFPERHRTEWLLIVDLDEFLWSKRSINLKDVFAECNNIAQVQFHHTMFGSNGHIVQPKSVVQGFTKRCTETPTITSWNVKYAINCRFKFDHLGVHYAKFAEEYGDTACLIIGDPYFILNHYSCQSRELWDKVKCTRGDGDHFRVRTESDFDVIDFNEVEDCQLATRQNHNFTVL